MRDSDLLVAYKSNKLIEASYRLTLQEQRLLLACIGKLDPQSLNTKMTITVDEFKYIYPSSKDNAERDLQLAVERLWDRSVLISNDDFKQEFRWIESKAVYYKGESKVELIFSTSVMPYLTKLEKQFTKIVLQNISQLSSSYTIRLYELLSQYKTIGRRIISVDEFRQFLRTENKYVDFKSLKQWVINPSLKELNEKTDLNIKLNLIKKGRKIDSLDFQFNFKED
ncbi:replication initiation protein (plasmid) [Photobacterium damselae subsp. damselae]